MIEQYETLIRQFRTEELFWLLAPNVAKDKSLQPYFLSILRCRSNVFQLKDRAEEIHQEADAGNPFMQYAWARYHDCVQPEPQSVHVMEKYYTLAMDAGIADARACIGLMYRDGDFGEADLKRYNEEMRKAMDEGSVIAAYHILGDMAYGMYGMAYEPAKAYQTASRYVSDMEARGDYVDGVFYHIMAHAQAEQNLFEPAIGNCKLAVSHGDSTAFWSWALIAASDQVTGELTDRDRFLEITEKGRKAGAADCYMNVITTLDMEAWQQLEPAEKEKVSEQVFNSLASAYEMGESDGAYFIGYIYDNGMLGFRQDHEEAWKWFASGAARRNAQCLTAMAAMVLKDHTAPEDCDEAFGYECCYKALMLGEGQCLSDVIEGYNHGYLTNHAAQIEQVYIPRYWDEYDMMHDDDDDDFENDIKVETEIFS